MCTDIDTEYSIRCVVSYPFWNTSRLYIISKSHGRLVLKQSNTAHAIQQTIYTAVVLTLWPSSLKSTADRSMVYTTVLPKL